MRVFVTGASGFIGAAVLRGDLANLDLLASAAASHGAVVHAGFNHDDWNGMDAAFAQDEVAVHAMLDALAGTGKPLL